MPIPAPVPFDIAPALSQYQTGIQTRVGLQDRQREWEAQATDAIMRAADLADTPEKWQRFITQIGSQFDGADLADATWENRDYYLSGNPQYRAQQERNRAAGAAASASAAAAATRQRRLSELVGGSAPAAGGVPAGAGGIPTLGTPRTGPPALSALGGAAAPAQQVSAEEAYIPGMETPTPPPPAPLATGAGMPMLGTPTAAPTFNAQANSQLVAMGFNPEQIAAIQQAVASGDPRQLAIVEDALTAAQERMLAGPAAPRPPVEVTAGATMWDPTTNRPLFTAPAAGGAAGNQPDDVRRYEYYADGERAAGRTPVPYGAEWFALDNAPAGGTPPGPTASALRMELRQDQAVRNYAAAAPIYATMVDAAPRENGAADLNLVYGLAKLFDPTSVVREGEVVMAQNTAGIPQTVLGIIQSWNGGAGLTRDTRAQLMQEARSRMASYEEQLQQTFTFYEGIARRAGISLADVIPEYEWVGRPDGAALPGVVAPPVGGVQLLGPPAGG